MTVSFAWENGKLTEFSLKASVAQTLCVAAGDREWTLALEPGKEYTVTAE